jgi:hypothetical protein
MDKASAKATLHALTINYDLNDPRQKENKGKIEALVDSAYKNLDQELLKATAKEWEDTENKPFDEPSTSYPDYGGHFEELIQYCMRWQRYPSRALAVVSCNALISTLAGRTYSYEDGNGVVYTALLTGASTSGKASIKKFCIHMLDNFDTIQHNNPSGGKVPSTPHHSTLFLGGLSYSSANNIVTDVIAFRGSLLIVHTEGAHSEVSSAGDQKNVLVCYLELATNHGQNGRLQRKVQNDKVPELFSPAVTSVRESVYEIQKEADALNKSSTSGVEGRRSRVHIGINRENENRNREFEIPETIKRKLKKLFMRYSNTKRHDPTKPYPKELWEFIKIEDNDYLYDLSDDWNAKRYLHLKKGDMYTGTFYGRLKERVFTQGGIKAVYENPDNPILTTAIVKTTVRVLEAEASTYSELRSEALSPWDEMISSIVSFFTGSLVEKNRTITSMHKSNIELLEKGACKFSAIKQGILKKVNSYEFLQQKHGDRFEQILFQKLEYEGISRYSKEDMWKLFKAKKGTILHRN